MNHVTHGKRETPSENPAEHQIHTYLECVNKFDFLRAEVEIHPTTGALKVRYHIEKTEGISDELHLRLQEHLKEFGLQKKYSKQINIHLSEQITAIRFTYDMGPDVLRQYLKKTSDSHKINFGINDWRTALFRGLVECDDFCEGGFERALGKKITPTNVTT